MVDGRFNSLDFEMTHEIKEVFDWIARPSEFFLLYK